MRLLVLSAEVTVIGRQMVAGDVKIDVKLCLGPPEVGEVLDVVLAVAVKNEVVWRIEVPAADGALEMVAVLEDNETVHTAAQVVVVLCCVGVPHPALK